MTTTIIVLCLLLIASFISIYVGICFFDKAHKVEFTAEKKGLEVLIDYDKLTFAKALELKYEYEKEGYSCYIVVRSRKEKK